MPELSIENTAEWVLLGKIASPHGIKGWVKIVSFCSPRENILDYASWSLLLNEKGEHVRDVVVRDSREANGRLTVSFEEVEDRNAAAQLGGLFVAVRAVDLPQLAAGEFYWRDLEGLQVVSLSNALLGRVSHLLETGANDVLVVKPTRESVDRRERLIPFLPDRVVKSVELSAGKIVVDWELDY